jgi:hypothetical protein
MATGAEHDLHPQLAHATDLDPCSIVKEAAIVDKRSGTNCDIVAPKEAQCADTDPSFDLHAERSQHGAPQTNWHQRRSDKLIDDDVTPYPLQTCPRHSIALLTPAGQEGRAGLTRRVMWHDEYVCTGIIGLIGLRGTLITSE